MHTPPTRFAKKILLRHSPGQVVAEYVMILTFLVAALATTKLKISATGDLDLSASAGSVTLMEKLSQSFTVWMRDILLIVSLPS
ncbi:MAG: hypothetical protein NTV34_08725 [Proteobacteria bacterium]|nr:hypothetical protein [Pseudomonadota bacterium]